MSNYTTQDCKLKCCKFYVYVYLAYAKYLTTNDGTYLKHLFFLEKICKGAALDSLENQFLPLPFIFIPMKLIKNRCRLNLYLNAQCNIKSWGLTIACIILHCRHARQLSLSKFLLSYDGILVMILFNPLMDLSLLFIDVSIIDNEQQTFFVELFPILIFRAHKINNLRWVK